MIVRPPKLTRVQGGLLKRGLPPFVLRHPGVEVTKLIKAIPTKHSQITIKAQYEALVDIARDPLGHPYLYVINGDRVGDNAACVASALAGAAAKNHRLPYGRFPWWHRPQGTGRDMLLEAELRPFSFGNPSMYIFDGLIEDSNMLKLERTRDLLQLYSGVPRILVLSGCANPVAFVQDRLKMVATRYLHLSDRNVFIQI